MDSESLSKFIQKMRLDKASYQKVHAAILGGQNSAAYNDIKEAIEIDDEWINTIEDGLYNIENIVRNPRKFIAEQEAILDVSKAKRVNQKTVRHLSQHTQFIQDVDKEGNVTPSKVLVAELEEDVAIYENRFVCALVDKLVSFVDQRYNDLSSKLKITNHTNCAFHTNFKTGKTEVSCNMEVHISEPIGGEANQKNEETLKRIEGIRSRLISVQNSKLMKILHKAKPVRPPIQKTNMLRHNVDYSACYKLWLFISAYKIAGFSVDVTEKNLPIEGDYYDDLTFVAALGIQAMVTDKVLKKDIFDKIKVGEENKKHFKILKKIDFTPTFGNEKSHGDESLVNEFYFNKMKKELTRATKKSEILDEKEISMSFRKFFRSLQSINDEMFLDVIYSKLSDVTGRTPLQKKQSAIIRQKAILRRRHQLSKLYREQLEKCLHAETRETLKLEKLEEALKAERKRKKTKAEKEKEKKLKEKIKKEALNAEAEGKAYEREKRANLLYADAEKEEKKRQKKEQDRQKREIQRYLALKAKYGDDADEGEDIEGENEKAFDEYGFYDLYRGDESSAFEVGDSADITNNFYDPTQAKENSEGEGDEGAGEGVDAKGEEVKGE